MTIILRNVLGLLCISSVYSPLIYLKQFLRLIDNFLGQLLLKQFISFKLRRLQCNVCNWPFSAFLNGF